MTDEMYYIIIQNGVYPVLSACTQVIIFVAMCIALEFLYRRTSSAIERFLKM